MHIIKNRHFTKATQEAFTRSQVYARNDTSEHLATALRAAKQLEILRRNEVRAQVRQDHHTPAYYQDTPAGWLACYCTKPQQCLHTYHGPFQKTFMHPECLL